MSVRMRPRVNTLAKMVNQPGGMRAEDALRKAEENLDTIKPVLAEEVEKNLASLLELLDAAATRPEKTVLDEAYLRSNQVAGMAGLSGMAPLGQAAFSLCELLDKLGVAERWSAEAVDVHLNAMRLLRRMPEADKATAHILQGLREVVARATA
jgi:hypothetical protein